MKIIIIAAALFIMVGSCLSGELDYEKLADAIFKAENSKAHPYGVMVKFKNTTPRQACINTCRNNWVRWQKAGAKGDYLEFLARRYAPVVGATNDPKGLNRNWLKNVRWFLNGQSPSKPITKSYEQTKATVRPNPGGVETRNRLSQTDARGVPV